MSKKPTDDKFNMIEFEKINHEIDALLKKLRGVCPCCLARGMIYRGSHLLADGRETRQRSRRAWTPSI